MSAADRADAELRLVRAAIARMRATIMALVFGMVAGTGLFVATVWLLVRGGSQVGLHLGLLGNYFPGYTVTWLGSLVGFGYGFLTGAVIGGGATWIYNRVVEPRRP